MQRIVIGRGRARPRKRWDRALGALALLLSAASCISTAAIGPLTPVGMSAEAPAPLRRTLDPAPLSPTLVAPQPASFNAAAQPFLSRAASATDERRSLDCLTAAIYYEAGSEPEEGQRAVAQVVLNRVRHSGFPASVCGVVYQGPMRSEPGAGCQFTFTCDGSLLRAPSATGWARARRLAADALTGRVYAPVGLATFYHADYVLPAWAPTLERVAMIGRHIFYRWPGAGGAPAAFDQPYAGREPVPVPAKSPAVPPISFAAASIPAAAPAPDPRYTVLAPQSQVRPEYLNSGMIRPELR